MSILNNEGVMVGRKQKRMERWKGRGRKDLLACLAEKGAAGLLARGEADWQTGRPEKDGPPRCGCGSDRLAWKGGLEGSRGACFGKKMRV